MDMETMTGQIRDAMRIKHDRLDKEIKSNIETAMNDMEMRGVNTGAAGILIEKACELFCKWQCDYLGKGDLFRKNYESLRDSMSMSKEYRDHGKE